MSSSQNEVEAWSSAQLGQKLEESNPEDLQSIRQAGILPEKISGILSIVETDYDPDFRGRDHQDPRRAEHTQKYQEVVKYWTSKVLSKAVHNGHDRLINRFIRVVEQETSIDKIDSLLRFSRWVTREAGITYLVGHMGAGKTDLGLLIVEVFWKELSEASEREVHVATNIQSTAEEHDFVDYIGSQPDLMEWLEKSGYKIFLFDEASSHASGYSGDASKVTRQMRSMVRLIRKYDGSMVIIGHDGKDLHPTVRELADYVNKTDKKEATVFKSVEDREGADKKFDMTQIPQTSLWYDTKEASSWEWASEEDSTDLELIIGEIYEKTSKTQTEIAEIFDVSQSEVSDYARKYRNHET